MNVAVMAVPLYIALILLELAYERYSGRHTYPPGGCHHQHQHRRAAGAAGRASCACCW